MRDPEATKTQILDAAEEEFAKYGLAGARTETIADRTGATKAMIYYYFKSKEGLYRAVFDRIAAELRHSISDRDVEVLPAEKALEFIIRMVIAERATHPHRGMLWFHEAIQNQGKYGELTGWQEGFWCIVKILERGMASGVFRQLDPFLTTINILGVCLFYIDARENLKSLNPDRPMLTPQALEQHAQQAIDLILQGVQFV